MAVLAGMIVGAVGCGRNAPAIYSISGKVTFQGKPVEAGMIRFSNPALGVDIMAHLQSGGCYSVKTAKGDGLPEGTYRVAIEPPRIDAPVGAMVPPQQPECLDIPTKYRNISTSGLTLTVQPRSNAFDVDMARK